MDLLNALYARMAVIRAREQLAMAGAVALGTGRLTKEEHQKAWKDLEAIADLSAPKPRIGPPDPMALAGLGIQVAA